MTGGVALTADERLMSITFIKGKLGRLLAMRYKAFMDTLRRYGLLDYLRLVKPRLADDEVLLLGHHADYVRFVKMMSDMGMGYLDHGEIPAYRGLYEDALYLVSATLTLVEGIVRGEYAHGFNPMGGHSHAGPMSPSEGQIFNDVVIAARALKSIHGYERVAIISVEGSHGSGTQEALYREAFLKVSVHRWERHFRSLTGRVSELGEGEGYGLNVNIPLPFMAGDDVFEDVLKEVIAPLIEVYNPDFIILQVGISGHRDDPTVALGLTSSSYRMLSRRLHELAHKHCKGRLLCLGGGGIIPSVAARVWLTVLGELMDTLPGDLRATLNEVLAEEPTVSDKRVWREVRRVIEELKRSVGLLRR